VDILSLRNDRVRYFAVTKLLIMTVDDSFLIRVYRPDEHVEACIKGEETGRFSSSTGGDRAKLLMRALAYGCAMINTSTVVYTRRWAIISGYAFHATPV